MNSISSSPYILKNRFTGVKQCVNQVAGKNLGTLSRVKVCLFTSPGDAKSRKAGLGNPFQDQLRHRINSLLYQEQDMHHFLKPYSVFAAALFLGAIFYPPDLWAHDGELLKDEITKLEKLFTGGYMRLGLLGVCGFAAIYGIVKQSGWIFASGILGCVFAYFMKDWITKTFTMIV